MNLEDRRARATATLKQCSANSMRWHEEQTDPMDNALSSWANSHNRNVAQEEMKILADADDPAGNGCAPGYAKFRALFDLDGNRVRAAVRDKRTYMGDTERWWVLLNEDGRMSWEWATNPRSGREYKAYAWVNRVIGNEPTGSWATPASTRGHKRKVSNLRKKGYVQGWEEAPARAYLEGRGTGLSGTCWTVVNRTDGGCPGLKKEEA